MIKIYRSRKAGICSIRWTSSCCCPRCWSTCCRPRWRQVKVPISLLSLYKFKVNLLLHFKLNSDQHFYAPKIKGLMISYLLVEITRYSLGIKTKKDQIGHGVYFADWGFLICFLSVPMGFTNIVSHEIRICLSTCALFGNSFFTLKSEVYMNNTIDKLSNILKKQKKVYLKLFLLSYL